MYNITTGNKITIFPGRLGIYWGDLHFYGRAYLDIYNCMSTWSNFTIFAARKFLCNFCLFAFALLLLKLKTNYWPIAFLLIIYISKWVILQYKLHQKNNRYRKHMWCRQGSKSEAVSNRKTYSCRTLNACIDP